jgi:hypothetical protein
MRFRTSTLSRRSTRWLLLVLVTSVLSLIATEGALASHFRYGHYNWQPVSGNTIDFTLQNAFRRDSYGCYSTVTLSPTACTGPGGGPGVGDVIVEFTGGTTFNPGDGTGTIGSPLGPLMFLVTSIDPANNWLFGSALDPASLPAVDTFVTHTYAAPGDYTAFIDSCCRISSSFAPNFHINNPDGGYRVETLVNVGTQGGNSSPISALPPIVLCPINAVCSFQVPGTDPNADTLSYRLSTSAEASAFGFTQPGPPHATNAAAVSSTGLYTWDTTGATLAPAGGNTLYSTQVTVEDRTAAGALKSKVAVDFLIQLVPEVGDPPVFDTPPTPACGSTQSIGVGGTLTFVVQASDPDTGDVVTLNAVGLPPGATMTPTLPTSGNPVSSTFSWTPAVTGTFVVTFTATDQTFQQAICSITIEAVEARNTCGEAYGQGTLKTNPSARFDLRARYKADAPAPEGDVKYQDSLVSFQSTDVTSFVISGGTATIKGNGTANGVAVTYEVVVTDGRKDTFSITLSSGYTASGELDNGRIVIRDNCK